MYDFQAISRATERACRADGYGLQVLVWLDGSTSEANGPNDIVGRANGSDAQGHTIWEHPVLRLRSPHSPDEVEVLLKE